MATSNFLNLRRHEEDDSPAAINAQFNKLRAASDDKPSQLQEAIARRTQRLSAGTGLSDKLGLDESGFMGRAVNLGASVASGAGKAAGWMLSAPSSLAAAAETANLNKADWAAYDAYTKGEATPEQMAQLNRDAGSQFTLGNVNRALGGNFDNATPLQRIEQADSLRTAARSINNAFDWSGIVNQSRRSDLSADLASGFQANWDKVKAGGLENIAGGIAGLLANAGEAAVNNPGAVAEYVAENIPQLALGAFGAAGKAGLAASNVGYAADNFQKGIEKYQSENNGAYPPVEVREEMAMWAAATALAEQVGDVSMLRGIGGSTAELAAGAGRRGLADVARQTATGVATEAATEGFQTYAEGQAGLKPATAEEIYEGAVIGGLVGGSMQGGAAALGATSDAVEAAQAKADADIAVRKETKTQYAEAVEKNDPSFFTKQGKNYAPDEAIRVLREAATEENQDVQYERAAAVVADAREVQDELNTRIEAAENPDEAKAQIQDAIARAEAAKANAAEEDKADMDQYIADLKEDIKAVDDDVANLDSLKQHAAKLEKQITTSDDLLNRFADKTNQETVAEASTEDEVTKTINLAMTSPDKLDSETVKSLVSDTSNALTAEQRTYLRAFDEARVLENAAKDLSAVNTEVLYGSDKHVGIKQYRDRINSALVAGNIKAAEIVMKPFQKFSDNHVSKAEAAQEAFAMAETDGLTHTIAPNKAGVWSVLPETLSDAARAKVGGLNIHTRSNNSGMIDALQLEAKAALAAVAELQAAVAAKRSTPQTPVATQPTTSVAAPVQAPARSSAKASVAPDQKPTVQSTPDDVVKVQNEGTVQAQDVPSSSDKKLSPTEVSKLGFKKVNQVAQNFSKSSRKTTDTSSKVLGTKDALSKLNDGELTAADFLPEGTELSEHQAQAIAFFQEKATEWMATIQGNLSLGNNPDFKFKDPIQFLVEPDVDGKADAEENVKTAIAFAAFSWLAENASMPRFHTLEDVKEMFGVDEYSRISNDLYKAVRTAGSNEKVVMNSLGQRAVAALGLKANKDAYANSQATLESSIGAHALKLLEDMGLVDRTTVSGAIIKAGLPADMSKDTNANANQSFISPARGIDGKVTESVKAISDSQRATSSILTKMFGAETEAKEPSNTPITEVQATTKNTDQKVPESLKKIIRHENSVPNYLRQDTWGLATKMSDAALLAIAGFDATAREDQHISNRDSVEAKNEGLVRELQNARDYFNTLDEDTPMYFEHSVWKQQRVGIATNLINPQTSKIHRFMIYRPEWTTKVSLTDPAMMDNFRLRVAEGLGVKADKQSNESSLQDFEKVSNDPAIKAGVQAIYATIFLGSDMTPEFEQAIVQAVKVGGENMHSLDALIALAHEFDALVSGKDSFTVNMVGEIDGVTNGPMLSHLLMGAAVSADDLYDMLNRGGFFKEGDDYKNYNLWRAAPGNQDLYETTIGNVMKLVKQVTVGNPAMADAMTSLYKITGKLEEAGKVLKDGRNIIKTPLTAMVFGSSIDGAIESMFEKFLDTAYAKMEKLETVGQAKELIGAINDLIEFGGSTDLITATNKADLLNHEFTTKQRAALEKAFNATLGNAVKESMDTDFAIFMNGRKQYNNAAQAAFQLYEAARSALTDQYMTELMDAGELDYTTSKGGVRTPNHDLNQDQRAELTKRLKPVEPILHTLFSSKDNNLDAGLAISKSSRKLSTKPEYQTVSQFGSETVDGFKTRKNAAYERTLAAPGVAMLPMGTHSTDSAISHNAVMGNGGTATQVLNVHDAHGSGLKHFQRTAKNLNKATFDAMMDYSPATQMKDSLDRVLVGMAKLLQDEKTAAVVAPKIKGALAEIAKKLDKADRADPLNAVVMDITRLSSSADQIKFQTLATMGAVDQYALEGGQYDVTDADRVEATVRLEKIQYAPSTETLNAVKQIQDVLAGAKTGSIEVDTEYQNEYNGNPAASLAKTVSPVINAVINSTRKPVKEAVESLPKEEQAKAVQATAKASKPLKTRFSPWGEIGSAIAQSDDLLVQSLEEMPVMNKAQAMGTLRAALANQQAPKNIKEFNAKLFTVLNKVMPNDVVVKYVTPETDASEIMEKGATAARGWYVAQNGKSEIYILSQDHKYSAVTPEVMLHEMVHATLAGVVENVATQHKEVQELVADLNNLMTKAKDYTEANGLTQFAPALENIHEFIAYGMTNLDFQKNVMSKISMQSKTKKNELVTGMKAFIQNMVAIIFRSSDRSSQAKTVNGMTILIGNVSGLFNAVAQNQTKADVVLNAMGINDMTTSAVFEAIKSTNPANQNSGSFEFHMANALDDIVEKLYGPFGTLKDTVARRTAQTPLDVYQKALATDELPFASKSLAAGFKINDQEAFVLEQVEAVVRASLDRSATQTTLAHSELRKAFQEARKQVKPMDFLPTGITEATANQAQKDGAQALWDFAFKIEMQGETSDYLSRFAALAIGHEAFASKLGFNSAELDQSATTVWGRLKELFNILLDMFTGKTMNVYAGQKLDEKVQSLIEKLVDIEAKKRAQLAATRANSLDKIEEGVRAFGDKAKDAIDAFSQSKIFKQSSNGYVRFTGTALHLAAAPERVEAVVEKIQEARDRLMKGKQGIAASLVSEMQGITDSKAVFGKLLLATKNLERARKETMTNVANFVKQSFGDKTFTPEQTKAVTNTFLRTDMSTLVDDYSNADLERLVSDTAFRKQEIAKHEATLKADTNGKFYLNSAKGLAYFMATGYVRIPFMQMNAHNIARLGGTMRVGSVAEAHATAQEAIIDKLISLQALDYLSQGERDAARDVFRDQNNRTDGGNGIEMILKLHKKLQAESKETLFQNNAALFMKGYTSEIYNPYIEVQIADDVEGYELEQAGFTKGAAVRNDQVDPSSQKAMYVLRDGGLVRRLTGILSFTGKNARGSRVTSATAAGRARIANAKQAQAQLMFSMDMDPLTSNKNYMAPVINNQGEVSDYRYLMSRDVKDNILERDNRFDQILGSVAGSMLDKQTAPQQNEQAIQALFDQYDAETPEQQERYLEIGPKVADPVMRENWNLLPQEAKDAAKRIWGGEKMYIRPDVLDMMFGYRKYSLSNVFDKDADERNAMEQLFVHIAETIMRGIGYNKGLRGQELVNYVAKAKLATRRAEDVWQEIVKEAKDIIVVRSGVVLLGNISSNLTLLSGLGVSIKDIVNHHKVAIKAASAYAEDSARLSQIETMLESGYIEGDIAELQQEANQLKDALNRNPVKELIDAGLMPTIVEDMAADEDIYSYKNRLARKTDKFTSKLNPAVKAAAKFAYISPTTKLYQGLNRTTQLSDFVARYTLYHHVIDRKVNPMSKEEAIRFASDAFVNYDIPSHRTVQYLNDMGVVMFTKYYLRIQKVLMKMFRENPARALMMIGFSQYFSNVPSVIDSSMWGRIGNNPFTTGAFKYPGVLDDLATVKAGMSPFN